MLISAVDNDPEKRVVYLDGRARSGSVLGIAGSYFDQLKHPINRGDNDTRQNRLRGLVSAKATDESLAVRI